MEEKYEERREKERTKEINVERLSELFLYYAKNQQTNEIQEKRKKIVEKIQSLFELDYVIETLENDKSQICSTYPDKIFLIKSEKDGQNINHEGIDNQNLNSIILKSSFARVNYYYYY